MKVMCSSPHGKWAWNKTRALVAPCLVAKGHSDTANRFGNQPQCLRHPSWGFVEPPPEKKKEAPIKRDNPQLIKRDKAPIKKTQGSHHLHHLLTKQPTKPLQTSLTLGPQSRPFSKFPQNEAECGNLQSVPRITLVFQSRAKDTQAQCWVSGQSTTLKP